MSESWRVLLAGVGVALLGGIVGWLANLGADRLPGRAAADLAEGDPYFVPRTGRWPRWALLEAATVAIFVLGWLRFGADLPALLVFWLWAGFFLCVLVIDLEHRRVLNLMLLPAACVALAASVWRGSPAPGSALLGGAVGFGIFFIVALAGRGKMGAGDVKLAGVIGLVIGYPVIVTALFWGILLGGLAALALLLTRRVGRGGYIAYAPYLCLGALMVLYRGL